MTRQLESNPHCPHCKAVLDGYTHVGQEDIKPQCGDVSVCNICAEVLEFDKDINLVPVKSETLDHIDLREIQKAQTIIRMMANAKQQ